MKVVVCCKFTPDIEDIQVTPEGGIDLTNALWSISEYDLQAVEAAAQLVNEAGGEAVALTICPENIRSTRYTKDLMSRGNLLTFYRIVNNDFYEADVSVLAKILASAVRKIGADVILFGEGSSDRYYRQTGMQTAAELGYAGINFVDKIAFDGDELILERNLEDEIEEIRVSLPCVLSVASTINTPLVPGMRAVLEAGKKPVVDLDIADLDIGSRPAAAIERIRRDIPPEPNRLKIILEGTPEETAAKLIAALKNDSVL